MKCQPARRKGVAPRGSATPTAHPAPGSFHRCNEPVLPHRLCPTAATGRGVEGEGRGEVTRAGGAWTRWAVTLLTPIVASGQAAANTANITVVLVGDKPASKRTRVPEAVKPRSKSSIRPR